MANQDAIEFDAIDSIHVLDWIKTESDKRARARRREKKLILGAKRRAMRTANKGGK